MMKNKERIIDIIYTSINDINETLPEEQRIGKFVDTVLFGSSGNLDSLGLVNLIVAVEDKIQDEFDVSITLADDRATSQKHSPFRSVESFVDYISLLLEKESNE